MAVKKDLINKGTSKKLKGQGFLDTSQQSKNDASQLSKNDVSQQSKSDASHQTKVVLDIIAHSESTSFNLKTKVTAEDLFELGEEIDLIGKKNYSIEKLSPKNKSKANKFIKMMEEIETDLNMSHTLKDNDLNIVLDKNA